MTIPKYPRHLSSDERKAVFKSAVLDLTNQQVRNIEQELGKRLSDSRRAEVEDMTFRHIQQMWTQERLGELEAQAARIDDLEKQLAGALKKISLLSRRLEEANHEA